MSSTNDVWPSRWSKVSTQAEEPGESVFRGPLGHLPVLRGKDVHGQMRAPLDDFGEMAGHQLVRIQVDHVHAVLRVLADFVDIGLRPPLRRVQGDDAGVVVVRAVHRPRAQPKHQPDHAGGRIDALVPDIRIDRQADAGHLRVEQVAVQVARDALDQQRHLFVAVQQPALGPVAERLFAHRAGVDRLDGRDEILQPLLVRALVGAEHALVLAGEGVAVVVLQQAAGADDDRRLAEVVQHLGELLEDVVGKGPRDHPPARFFDVVQERPPVVLFLTQPPAAVFDQERIEHVGADVERIVGFQQRVPAGTRLAEDRAGQQHAHRFAADQPRADHPPPDRQHVAQRQVLLGHAQQPLVARERHPHQRAGQGHGVFGRRLAPLHRLPSLLGLVERAVPRAQAEPHGIQAGPGPGRQDLGGRRTLGDRQEAVAFPGVQHVHRGRVAVLDLAGLQVQRALMPVHVDEDLRGPADGRGGLEGMGVAEQRKIGQRFQVVHVGAGEHEEVAQHPVAAPLLGQRRQAVEDEKRAPPRLADHAADLRDELLEPRRTVQLADGYAVSGRNQRRMVGEAEVDQAAARVPGGLAVRSHERSKVLDRIHLPNQVVARQQSPEHPVQRGHPRAEIRIDHRQAPLLGQCDENERVFFISYCTNRVQGYNPALCKTGAVLCAEPSPQPKIRGLYVVQQR